MTRRMNLLLSLVLLFAAAAVVSAQVADAPQKKEQDDAYLLEHRQRRAKNPEGVSFTVRLKDNRTQFHQGEVITLELGFASSKPDAYTLDAATYDRSGRLHADSFVLDPRDGAVDPLRDYFSSGVFMLGGLRSIPDLTDKPYLITADLNEWRRIDQPGHYRMYVMSSRVGKKGGGRVFLENADSAVISNVIEFDVLPPDEKWSKQKLTEIVAALSKAGEEERRTACIALRFLGTTAAVSEMSKRFRGDDQNCEWQYKFGLVGSPHRDFVIRDMENTISLRDQPVTQHYITTLTLLEFAKRAGDEPPYPGEQNEKQKLQWQSQMDQRENVRREVRLHYLRQLMLALPQKQEHARATSLQTLLDFREDLNTRDFAQWTTLLASMSDVFGRLSREDQLRLLTHQWKPIASAAMLPVLREVLKYDPKQETQVHKYILEELRSIALRRLYELSPEEGRRLILDEIRRAQPRLNREALSSLPDETLPELNTVLLNNLEQSRRGDSFYTDLISELIERYATDEIFSRVRALYDTRDAGEWPCRTQAALVAYFLRVAPPIGGEYVKKALYARGRNYPRCHNETLKNVAALHMSAEVEAAAIAALDDQEAAVVAQAASVLAAYGSADAEKALWRRLEKWQSAVQSRSEEVTEELNADQKTIENALREALTRGEAWLSDPAKLKRLRDLCVTEGGRVELDRLIEGWDTQIEVFFAASADEVLRISVAHYWTQSFDSLKQRLLQFPKGTVFKLKITTTPSAEAAKSQEVFAQIKTYLEEHGMKLKREPE